MTGSWGEPLECPICGGVEAPVKTWLRRCANCGFQRSNLSAGAGTGVEGLETLRRNNFEVLLDRLERERPMAGLRVLEVGAARGWFLEAAERRGACAVGIEPETANADIARAAGRVVEDGFFPNDLADRAPYDMIVFNDVFEHIPRPWGVLGDVEALLKPGGRLVVNLPSSDGALYRVATALDRMGVPGPFERLWQKGFPSPHVSYFNPRNLRLLVEDGTALRRRDAFRLPSLSRRGLWARLRSGGSAAGSAIQFVGLWGMSFALPAAPADIHVGVFERSA